MSPKVGRRSIVVLKCGPGHEIDRQSRIDTINEFIESELNRLESVIVEDVVRPGSDKLNELFRSSLALNDNL